MIHQQRSPINSRSPRTHKAVSFLGFGVLLLLLGVSGLIGFGGRNLLFPPTPTFTGTPRPLATRTPDFRATQVQEDRATQVAFLTSAPPGYTVVAPTPVSLAVMTTSHTILFPVIPNSNDSGSAVNPLPSATTVISLPLVPGGSQPPTPLGGDSPLPTPTATPFNPSPLVTATIPIDTPIVLATETPTLGIPTPTFTPTPSPTAYFVQSLNAVVTSMAAVELRMGPSTLYEKSGTLNNAQQLVLLGRDNTGDWITFYWENQQRWVRQAYLLVQNNQLQPGAPPGAQPNDIRWLSIQPAPLPPTPFATPITPPTPPPPLDYPLYRYDRGNSGRAPALPFAPVQLAWPAPATAFDVLTSPLVVMGQNVIVASADHHLYSFHRVNGNQNWRIDLGQVVTAGPVAQDGLIYVIDINGTLMAVQDLGNAGQVIWQMPLTVIPKSPLTLAGNLIYFVGQDSANTYHLYACNRFENGKIIKQYDATAAIFQPPAIGDQLLFVADSELRALDINNFELVWKRNDIVNISAPPLYTANGVLALAELFVAESSGRILALDANTGRILWSVNASSPVTGLAVNDSYVYGSGDGFVTGVPRRGGAPWRVGVGGYVVGGPIVDADQILVATQTGGIQFVDPNGGGVSNLATAPATIIGPLAVSGEYIFAPIEENYIYALRGQQ